MTTQLTERERRVISLAAEGFTRQEIGEELGISKDGADKHLRNIFCKLGARNLPHAIALVVRVTTLSRST